MNTPIHDALVREREDEREFALVQTMPPADDTPADADEVTEVIY